MTAWTQLALDAPAPAPSALRIKRSDWLRHRTGLLDAKGLALHGAWHADGPDRVLDADAPADAREAARAYLAAHGIAPRGGA